MTNLGLFIAKQNSTISDNGLDFDSRHKHLLVDLDIKPKHFDITNLTGTNISSTGPETTETLFTIAHGLTYTPKIETYIFVSGNFNLYTGSGSYYRTYYPYSGTSGVYFDRVVGEADSLNYYIRHRISTSGGAFTSNAASFPLQIKYYIFSNQGSY
jgi:hypothetical protein